MFPKFILIKVKTCINSFPFLFLFLTTLSCFAQKNQWQNYGIYQGLPQSNVTSITQDRIGYLWLGTKGSGLVRFDGKEFTTYHEKDSLPSGYVNHLIYKNDSLFIATRKGLGILHKGKITAFNTPEILKIIRIKRHTYMATVSGIYYLKKDYTIPLKISHQIDLQPVKDIAYYKKHFWITTPRGLWKTPSLIKRHTTEQIAKGNFSSVVVIRNRLWASDIKKGVFLVLNDTPILKRKIETVKSIKYLHNEFWLLTENLGIKKFSLNLEKEIFFNNAQLKDDRIQDFFKGRNQDLWIATENTGLYKVTQNNFTHFTTKNGLSSNRINALATQRKVLWVATGSRGVNFRKFNSFLTTEFKELQNATVTSIAIDSSQNIWLGTQKKGLMFLKHQPTDSLPNTSKTTFLKELDIPFPSYQLVPIGNQLINIKKSIQQIAIDNNTVWLADGKQIHQLKTSNGIIFSIQSFGKNQGLQDSNITALLLENHQLWYATKSGNLGSISNNQLKNYSQILGVSMPILCFVEKGNYLYLGTASKGIWVIDKENPRKAFQLSGTKKLNSQNVRQLLFDVKGHMWVGTEKGINKLVLANNTIKNIVFFSKNDGFLGIETINNSIVQDKDGALWFGTVNGLTQLKKPDSKTFTTPPTLQFEGIEVDYQPINFTQTESALELEAHQNSVSFQFKTVDLNHPDEVVYQWQLNGNISPWTSSNSVDFANLNYGTYTFSVRSRNRDWIESKPIVFKFVILKPWYLQSWFLLSTGIGLFVILILIVVVYTQRIKKKSEQEIEKLTLENQLISLEQKALQLQMNPHFVFNVLNGIKAMGTTGKLEKMNETINEFAVLLRGVLQNSREEFVSVYNEIKILKNYLLLEQKLNNNTFDFLFDIQLKDLDAEEVLIPSLLIQPFVENSIKHGFKGLDRKGKITVQLVLRKAYIHCVIKDNGIGLKASQKNKKESHQSLAVNVTKQRLQGLLAYPNFTLKGLKEDDRILGTLVSFHLPYKTDF